MAEHQRDGGEQTERGGEQREALSGVTRPPEVRIACRKDLPRERVYELRRELEGLRKKGIINSTVATVVEAPNQ